MQNLQREQFHSNHDVTPHLPQSRSVHDKQFMERRPQNISQPPALQQKPISHSQSFHHKSSHQRSHTDKINVHPSSGAQMRVNEELPEIRKYKKKFKYDINCASLWGVNLLVGTKKGLFLLDRQGQG